MAALLLTASPAAASCAFCDPFGASGFAARRGDVREPHFGQNMMRCRPGRQRRVVYAGPGGEPEDSMKRTLRQGGEDALNLYSTTAGLLGWAYTEFTAGRSQKVRDAWLSCRA